MPDEQYHEFHLEGKQLVFLFMAAMAVVVVSFLCGVMVGRGVRMPESTGELAASADLFADPTAARGEVLDEAERETGPIEPAPAQEQEPLTYFDRLNSPAPVPETLVRDSPPPAAPAAPPALAVPERIVDAAPAATPPSMIPPAPAPARAATVSAEPPETGYAVQVASLTRRAEAETVARGLASKGYPSFVQPTADGRFRVRVGKYADRRQAEVVARRLEREENFKEPWVDR